MWIDQIPVISEKVFRVLSDSISSSVGFDIEMLFVLVTVPDEGDASQSLSLYLCTSPQLDK